MIKKVCLENWRTHRKSEFEFGAGTNVLVGVIGSGKTTIMDAICFALYGTFPALAARRLSQEEVIMSKPSEMQEASVKLLFEYGGEEYSVERIIRKKGTNEAKLLKGGRLIAGPKTTDVSGKIEEITEVNYDLFSRAVYSEQNQIDYFLRLNPSQRKEKFDELLLINKYDSARASAVRLSNMLKGNAQEKKALLERQKGLLKGNEIEDAERRVRGKEREIGELEAKEKKALENIGIIKAEILSLEKNEAIFKSLREKTIRLRAREEGILREIKDAKRELHGKDEEEIKKEIERAEEALKKYEGGKKLLLEERKGKEKHVNEFMQKIKLNEGRAAELGDSLLQLGSAKAACPLCKRSLDEHKKKELEREIEAEQKRLNAESGALLKERESAEREICEAEKREESVALEIEGEKEGKYVLKALLDKAKAIGRQAEELEGLGKEISDSEKKFSALDFDESALIRKREKHAKENASIDSFKGEIRAASEVISEIRQNLGRMREAKRQAEELEREIQGQERIWEKLALFTNALKATQAELRLSLVQNVNAAMEDIWPRVYPYGDYKSAKIEIEGGDYEIMVRERGGKWVRVEGILSGGERSAAALTLRIAISLVLTQNLGWIILDEPTHNLDSETVMSLSRMMKSHLPELVGQIFIITHDPIMENAASSYSYVLERDKNSDGISSVRVAVKA